MFFLFTCDAKSLCGLCVYVYFTSDKYCLFLVKIMLTDCVIYSMKCLCNHFFLCTQYNACITIILIYYIKLKRKSFRIILNYFTVPSRIIRYSFDSLHYFSIF